MTSRSQSEHATAASSPELHNTQSKCLNFTGYKISYILVDNSSYLSTSPKTISCVPIIVTTSANMCD